MSNKVFSAVSRGLETVKIEVEIKTVFGKPSFIIIGLANRVIDESRERISAALLQCGVRVKARKTVVNLAPADLSKNSSSVELAIAVAILKLYGLVKLETDQALFLGELALDGRLRKIRAFVSIVLTAKSLGFKQIYFPKDNLGELPQLRGIDFYPLASLQEFLAFARGRTTLVKVSPYLKTAPLQKYPVDLADVVGQSQAKEALAIVAAGGHNLLLFGPPGSGKSLLAHSLLSILPDLNEAEFLEVNKIYSLCGLLNNTLLNTRPFRAPHQSISQTALIGGGLLGIPGEISLAHRGILFLDEFAQFKPQLLEMLRQPLETGQIVFSYAKQHCLYPARFTLVAASNPCPCGFAGSQHPCRCSEYDLHRYRAKFSGPILDRIDLMLRVDSLPIKQLEQALLSSSKASNSVILKLRVEKARQKQRQRYLKTTFNTNADLDSQAVLHFCQIDETAYKLLNTMANYKKVSARSYFKLFKVAQTIADLEEAKIIHKEQVLQAFSFRDFFV